MALPLHILLKVRESVPPRFLVRVPHPSGQSLKSCLPFGRKPLLPASNPLHLHPLPEFVTLRSLVGPSHPCMPIARHKLLEAGKLFFPGRIKYFPHPTRQGLQAFTPMG